MHDVDKLREELECARRKVLRLQRLIVELMLFRSITSRSDRPYGYSDEVLDALHEQMADARQSETFAQQRVRFATRR